MSEANELTAPPSHLSYNSPHLIRVDWIKHFLGGTCGWETIAVGLRYVVTNNTEYPHKAMFDQFTDDPERVLHYFSDSRFKSLVELQS